MVARRVVRVGRTRNGKWLFNHLFTDLREGKDAIVKVTNPKSELKRDGSMQRP